MSLLERLRSGDRLVSDGAMGTLLMEAGLQPGEAPEAMVLRAPDAVRGVAEAYLLAGADIVHTNTFGASSLKLAEVGLEDRAAEISRRAVELARDAVGESAYVSVSVGPCGRMLEPYGDTDEDTVFRSFLEQIEVARDAGADLVTVETMIDPREAVQAVRAAKHVADTLPVLVTLTFDLTPVGFRTVMGTSVAQAAEAVAGAGADVVGSNCGNGVEVMVEVARALRAATKAPLLIQANAGVPEIRDGAVFYPESAADFAAATPALLDAGVSIIGGCCGTTPEHIRAVKRAVQDHRQGS